MFLRWKEANITKLVDITFLLRLGIALAKIQR